MSGETIASVDRNSRCKLLLQVPLFWRFQLAGWLVFIVLSFPLKLTLMGSLPAALLLVVVRDGSSILLTIGMRSIYQACWSSGAVFKAVLIFVACTLGGLLQSAFFFLLHAVVPDEAEVLFTHSMEFNVFYERTGLLFTWSFLYFGVRQSIEGIQRDLQLARAESARRCAEIQLLRAQMNPHFLYNSLNTLIADAGKSPEHLKELVRALAEYLRYSLENRNKDLVPLGKEMDAIGNYLTVEKARFREKLEIESFVPEETRNQMVPGIVIQPLIENAIKYGLRTSPKPCKVKLVISNPDRNMLRIEVTNTGKWVELIARPDGGVGLENLRQRLELLYADRHRFQIEKPDGFVTVRVEIPISA